MPPISPELANNIGDSNYWPASVAELMKRIPQVLTKAPPKDDKLVDRVARCNPKVYDINYDPVVLEKCVRAMEKIFAVVEVPGEKKLNIRTYYVFGEADIWWNIIKGRLIEPEFTWSKFLNELRVKFYLVIVQRQKEKEFMELKISGNMIVM